MFKKFLSGIVFGSGFAIAFVFICYLGLQVVIPTLVNRSSKAPEFNNEKSAAVIEQETSSTPQVATDTDFNLYKSSRAKMEVPIGGGILSIASVNSPAGNKYPSTYQLWITESEFRQVKTTGQNVAIEQLKYPNILPIDAIDATMRKQAGYAMSTMTIHSETVTSLKMGKGSWHDQDMNGKTKITEEGVVFIQPNEF